MTTNNKVPMCSKIKVVTDSHGDHIKHLMYKMNYIPKQDEQLTAEEEEKLFGERVGTVTYHLNTHSITIKKVDNCDISEIDIALAFMEMFKADFYKDLTKSVNPEKKIPMRAIWCRQLNRHFK